MKNVASTKVCYGCGVCAIACPQKIISIKLNPEGFYAPFIFDEKACTNCGLCLSVCAHADDKVVTVADSQPVTYAAWSKDSQTRATCSSGGIGFEIGKHLIGLGYKACGVRYVPERKRTEHFMAATVEDFKASIGSKYLQSYTLPGFEMLNRKDKFFMSGTPCQIDSIRRYIRKHKIEDNFVLMDFFCHGVPSMHLWRKYTEDIQRETGPIKNVYWRDKRKGWHDSYAMVISGKKKQDYCSSESEGDLFYRFFLGDLCLNEPCYEKCKYKMTQSAADIRIGDLWGKAYKNDQAGVSALLAFSEKGKYLVDKLTNCTLTEKPLSIVVEEQMRHGAKRPSAYRYIKRSLNGDGRLAVIARSARLIHIVLNIHRIIFNRLAKLWKREWK